MKRWISILLTAVLLLGALALAEEAPAGEAQLIPATTSDKLTTMGPVLDSLVRNMGIEGEVAYSAEDAEFVWTQLYLHGMNWGFLSEGVEAGEQVRVPGDVLRGYAQASFNGMEALPEIPEDMSGIHYDEAADVYVLGGSEDLKAYTHIVVERYAEREDGSVLALVDLYNTETNMRLGSLLVDMAPAPAGSAWPYFVTNAVRDDMMDVSALTFETCHITAENWAPVAEEPAATEAPAVTVQPTATPVPTLKSGSKGAEVTKLQKRLAELGYPCGSVDGDFGKNTHRALRYFQSAAGLNQDGVATEAVQRALYAASAPAYEQYVSLAKGDAGIRVEDLQARLRKLGYLAEPVDGIYGSRTKAAVSLFQDEAGMKATGTASVKTIRALMARNAPECSSYIQLYRGDTGFRVSEMQEQLKRLGYLAKATGKYDSATVAAVKAFAAAQGVESNGRKADEVLVKAMFDAPTPTPVPTVEPTAEPTVEPTAEPTAEPTVEPTAEPTTPAETEKPVETEKPAETEEPVETEKPAETEKPVETEEPAETEKPAETEGPVETEKPAETEKPVDDTKLVLTEEQLELAVIAIRTQIGEEKTEAEAICWLQKQLGVTENGVYNAATKEAVEKWQQDNGVEIVDGVVNEAMAAVLNKK